MLFFFASCWIVFKKKKKKAAIVLSVYSKINSNLILHIPEVKIKFLHHKEWK